MFLHFLKSLTVVGFVALSAAPATADGPVLRLTPHIEIHLGTSRPPVRHREVRPRTPGWGYAWVPGSWDWQGGDWVWIDGRWERPERNVYWVSPRYVPEYGHWRYIPGHWSNQKVQDGDDYRGWKQERQNQRERDRERWQNRSKVHDAGHDRGNKHK